jgi:hypothetical protein
MAFRIDEISVNLPFGVGGVTIKRTAAQMRSAWALYVELATRISSQKLEPGQGSCREALNSLYTLFDVTRTTLKEAGPDAAEGPQSVGPIAIAVLNEGLRPFMVRWHGSLSAFEDEQTTAHYERFGGDSKPVIDEAAWAERDAFYDALEVLRQDLAKYVDMLGRLAGVSTDDR